MSENEAWIGTSPEERASGAPEEVVVPSPNGGPSGHRDFGTERISAKLENAASAVRERAAEAGGVRERVGNVAADRIEKTSDYFKQRDSRDVAGDFSHYVREHPMQAAAGALMVGYVIGRLRS